MEGPNPIRRKDLIGFLGTSMKKVPKDASPRAAQPIFHLTFLIPV